MPEEDENSTTPPANADNNQQPPAADPPKGELQLRIDAVKAETDPAKALKLIDDLAAELEKTRKEAGGTRIKFKELKSAHDELKKAADERKRAEMTELERAQADIEKHKTELEQERQTRQQLEARLAFSTAGVSDIEAVQALWLTLPADERSKTTPDKWAKELKERKPHLFSDGTPPAGGPNPRNDGAGKPGAAKAGVFRPKNRAEAVDFMQGLREQYGGR